MSSYDSVGPDLVDELKLIIGEEYVIFDDVEKFEVYSHDEVADMHYARLPEVMVKSASTEGISVIMKLAN